MKYLKLFERFDSPPSESVFYDKLEMRTEDAFDMIEYSDSYCNLYPGYNDADSKWSDEYYYESREIAYRAVNEALDILDSLPDEIPVYRTITVRSIDEVDLENLGESWSYHKMSALEFGSHIRATVLLSGTIASEFVDWEATVKLHFQFSGAQMGDDENEVRVDYPENIQGLKMEWIGK